MSSKSIITAICALVLIACSRTQQNPAATIMSEIDNPSGKVMVLAHRGDWRNAPENSIRAYENAIQMGAQLIEVDVHNSSDGVLINMHDATLNRTTSGKGRISDHPASEILSLTLKDGHNYPTHHHPCTIEEVLITFKDRCVIVIDKADGYYKELYELASKTGSLNQIILKTYLAPSELDSISLDIIKKVRFLPCVSLDKENCDEKIASFIKMGAVGFELTYKEENGRVLNSINAVTGKKLCFLSTTLLDEWCGGKGDDKAVENAEEDACWGHITELGANIFQTDRPSHLISYLKGKGLLLASKKFKRIVGCTSSEYQKSESQTSNAE